MADIFISYARVDKDRVRPLVTELEEQGWSVWWDPEISGGDQFDDVIAEELEIARCVIVVWSRASVKSRWVKGEAREGAERGVLVPVAIDAVKPPIDLRAVHTLDLQTWRQNKDHDGFNDLIRAVARLAGKPDQDDRGVEALRARAAARKQIMRAGWVYRAIRSVVATTIGLWAAVLIDFTQSADASGLFVLSKWFYQLTDALGLQPIPLYGIILSLLVVGIPFGLFLQRWVKVTWLLTLISFASFMTFVAMLPSDFGQPLEAPGARDFAPLPSTN